MPHFLLQTVISLNHCDNTLQVYVPRPPQNLYYIREEQLVSEDFQGQSRGVIKINQHRKLCQHITRICPYQLPQEMQCLRQEYEFLCWIDKVGRHTWQYSAGNLS